MSAVHRALLRTAIFTAGALLMALEISAFRIIGKTFGSALRETTAVIAVFLAAMSAGYWAGGRIGDRWPRAFTLAATLFAASLSCFCVPWLDARLSPLISRSSFALATHAFFASSILFVIPTFLLAATSPIAVRLFATSTGESGSTAGSISAISTAGSIFGSLATAFFLIDWLASINRTVIFVGLGAAATAALTMVVAVSSGRRAAALIAAAAILLLLTGAFARSGSIDRALLAPLPNTRVIFSADSPYHHVTVRERGPWRELSFDIATQSRMKIKDPLGPGAAYTDIAHLAKLMRPATRRILLIGLGGGTMAKQFAGYYPDTTVDVVDVDPLIAGVARRFFEVRTSDRLRIHHSDGRAFLKRSSGRWDLILIDAYTTNGYGDTIPPHLTTREFFREAAAHLNEGGVFHFHCAFHSTALLAAIDNTVRAVFPFVARTRGEILGSAAPLVTDSRTLIARAHASRASQLPTLDGAIEAMTVAPLARDAPILTDDYAPVDRLARLPVR